jgi:hypothetical protein
MQQFRDKEIDAAKVMNYFEIGMQLLNGDDVLEAW